jgi:hypothetical protein
MNSGHTLTFLFIYLRSQVVYTCKFFITILHLIPIFAIPCLIQVTHAFIDLIAVILTMELDYTGKYIMAYLLKARTMETGKQPLLGNAPTHQ